ncbi:hypothetical protein [Paraburkholderia ferrariae]|uniref:hypothetical protein n=1 Tax=Paraburkholderia ferrariae TaxID=386056 RepID=UPI000694DBFF|nr:hypothetical protein [Paraburkholderia ferrariae]
MVSDRIFHKPLTAWLSAAATACVLALAPACACADGPPLILDTQKGISDGQKGLVLQNAPLSHEPMVAAKQPAAPAGLATDPSPPYIVAPYIEVPGGGGSRPNPPRPRPAPQTAPAQ